MAATVTVSGTITLDESAGLQIGGVATTSPVEDNNDNDIAVTSLQTLAPTFYSQLSTYPASAHYLGAAQSSSTMITVTGATSVASLGFSDASGAALPVWSSGVTGASGVSSNLTAVNGGAIGLFADPTLGSRMVLGVDGSGDVVLALFMQPNSTLTAATIYMAQFEAISNPVTTNPDDAVLLGGLGVAAGTSTVFNFNTLPSGQNLFGVVGTTTDALVVIGKTPVLNADGTFTNTSNTINTSQGGGGVTIGVNNQMFDPGEGAYFTFVENPDARYLSGVTGGLDQNEADDADNILYNGGTRAVSTSFTTISQVQGNSASTMKITAYDIGDSPQGRAFVSGTNGLGTGTIVGITSVKVNGVTASFTVSGDGVTVGNLHSGDTITWTTSAPHDRVLIEDVAGKFDIGAFGTTETTPVFAPLTGVNFEDDGPTIGPIANSIVDFAVGSTATKSLVGAVGTDPNAAPYTLTNFTASLTVNGVDVHGVLAGDAHSVTYYADTNGDTIFGDTGDTAYYQLSLNQTANSGAGSYTFNVLVAPPPAELNFNFNALPSGQNLFGTVGDTADALVVIGKTPVLNADGTFTNTSNTINTSQGGGAVTIGVNNQMFDPGEGAYFTLVQKPAPTYLSGAPGGLDQNEADDADNIVYSGGTREVTTMFTKISQTQGNSAATMKITAYDIGDSPQGRDFVSGTNGLGTGSIVGITSVKVNDVAVSFNVSGNGVTVANLHAGDKITWTTSAPHDRVLIEDVAGKFDIGGFGAIAGQPTPDQTLSFTARATDGDGDTANSNVFLIGIDGTGPFHDGVVAGV